MVAHQAHSCPCGHHPQGVGAGGKVKSGGEKVENWLHVGLSAGVDATNFRRHKTYAVNMLTGYEVT